LFYVIQRVCGIFLDSLIDNKLLFDGKSIKKEKCTVKEEYRASGKGKEEVF
jgi:hypothetical protein